MKRLVWVSTGIASVAGAIVAQPTRTTPRPTLGDVASKWYADTKALAAAAWTSAKEQATQLNDQLKAEAAKVQRPSGVRYLDAKDLAWCPPSGPCPERVVLLIHGLDEPGDIWDDLAPALREAGYRVARFDYPDDQHIADSATLLGQSLTALRESGVKRVDLVCHSMGGLVARDTLTRPGLYACSCRGHDALPNIERFIMLGTPAGGSPWARLEAISEAREVTLRWARSPNHNWRELLGFMNDGHGEAGIDLSPGSAFLQNLDSRGWPKGVATTCIAADFVPPARVDEAAARVEKLVASELGPEQGAKAAQALRTAAATLGDGVVPVASASPAAVADTVKVSANHRGMIRYGTAERTTRELVGAEARTPPAIPIVLDRLARPAPE